MKKGLIASLLVSIMLCFSSCQAIASIFKAGMWWGIILVVIVIALIIWIFSKLMGRK